ncbi:hypothetical protein [Empedobacter tilapiae]|uniref:hypothetical protein n=1 Tax=Empedobacter tilapiae TaxID=2491114 RepID=UPI0014578A14|nr:hypothetical protein [Empedobacter tilapiae]
MESGVRGESFNYYKDNLAISLKAFETEEGKELRKLMEGKKHLELQSLKQIKLY